MGHESTVRVLLQNGADLNLQNQVTSRKMVMIDDDDDDDNYMMVDEGVNDNDADS